MHMISISPPIWGFCKLPWVAYKLIDDIENQIHTTACSFQYVLRLPKATRIVCEATSEPSQHPQQKDSFDGTRQTEVSPLVAKTTHAYGAVREASTHTENYMQWCEFDFQYHQSVCKPLTTDTYCKHTFMWCVENLFSKCLIYRQPCFLLNPQVTIWMSWSRLMTSYTQCIVQ